jgi:hypothetical protein
MVVNIKAGEKKSMKETRLKFSFKNGRNYRIREVKIF